MLFFICLIFLAKGLNKSQSYTPLRPLESKPFVRASGNSFCTSTVSSRQLTIIVLSAGRGHSEGDRWSRDERIKSSTSATTPESVSAKTPIGSIDEDSAVEKKYKRPIGGVAVLPPMEMKKIEDKRQSSIDIDQKSPERKSPHLDRSDSLNRKYGKRDSKILEEVRRRH